MFHIIVVTIVYLLVVAYLGYKGYKGTKNSSDYLVAGRKIHPMVMALSYGATFISTSAIVGFGGAAGVFGMGLLWLTFLNIFLGIFIAFIFFGKRTRKMGLNLNAHTFPELLGLRYQSKFMQGFAGVVIFIFMPIYASVVLKGGVNFIETYFGIPFEVSLLFFVAIIALYVSMGGLKGVMYADAFQGAVMFAGMTFLLIFIYSKLGGVTTAHQQLTAMASNPDVVKQTAGLSTQGFRGWTVMPKGFSPLWWELVSTIIMGVGIGVLAQPQLVVRFMTVKSNRELNRAVLSGGLFILMMTGVAFVVGSLSNVLFFNETGKMALAATGATAKIIPGVISKFVPGWFGAIFLVTLLAAAMSTLSSQFHAMGTALGRDVYQTSVKRKTNSVFITRIGILIVILISTALTWLSQYLDASMAIIATGTALFFGLCAAAFLPAYIGALYFKSMPRIAAISGMIAGFATSAFWIFFVHVKESGSLQLCNLVFGKPSIVQDTGVEILSKVDPLFLGLPVSVIVTGIVWYIYTKVMNKQDIDSSHVEECFKGI